MSFWNGFEGEPPRAYHFARENCVGSKVRAHINEQIRWSHEVEKESHVGKFVKACVDISRQSSVSTAREKTRSVYPTYMHGPSC